MEIMVRRKRGNNRLGMYLMCVVELCTDDVFYFYVGLSTCIFCILENSMPSFDDR